MASANNNTTNLNPPSNSNNSSSPTNSASQPLVNQSGNNSISPPTAKSTTNINSTPPAPPTVTTGQQSGTLPDGITISERALDVSSWPADLILDLGKSNWMEWSQKLTILVMKQGFAFYLDGSLPCPDYSVSPDAYLVWHHNDDVLRGFILERVSLADVHHIDCLSTSHLMFEALRNQHEEQGPYTRVALILKAWEIQFTYETPLRDTLAELRNYHRRIIATGELTEDDIFAAILLRSMNKDFGHLRRSVEEMTIMLGFSSEIIARRILQEDELIRRRVAAGYPANPNTAPLPSRSAFAAVSNRRPRGVRPICANCKRDNHSTDYCIALGGKMAGRSIEEARAAFCGAMAKTRGQNSRDNHAGQRSNRSQHSWQSAHIMADDTSPSNINGISPQTRATSTPQTVFINGLPYVVDPSYAATNPPVDS